MADQNTLTLLQKIKTECDFLETQHNSSATKRLAISYILHFLLIILTSASAIITIVVTIVGYNYVLYYISGGVSIITSTTIPAIQKFFNFDSLGSLNQNYSKLFFCLSQNIQIKIINSETTKNDITTIVSNYSNLINNMPDLFCNTDYVSFKPTNEEIISISELNI